jgi:hypothetical protein
MSAPLSERVAVAETEIKTMSKMIENLEAENKKLTAAVGKLQDTYHWVMGVATCAGVVLTIFAEHLKKMFGL